MNKGIVIGSSLTRKETWLADLLASMKGCAYPYKVFYLDTFELSVIQMALATTNFDEFLFLPDSTVIQDLSFFDMVFQGTEGMSVSVFNEPCLGAMYMMKYRRKILETMPIPVVPNKKMAVFWEVVFNEFYVGLESQIKVLFPEVKHSETFMEKHGRLNMVMGNKYLLRFKGSWGQTPLD